MPRRDEFLGETRGGDCDNRVDPLLVRDEMDVVRLWPVTDEGSSGRAEVGGGSAGGRVLVMLGRWCDCDANVVEEDVPYELPGYNPLPEPEGAEA